LVSLDVDFERQNGGVSWRKGDRTMVWDTEEFKNLVRGRYGEEQLAKVERPLTSVSWKLVLAQYHAEESKRLYRSYLTEEPLDELIQVVNQVLLAASSSEEASKFVEARILSEAHVIAYAQSLHSVADILAQVIYLGLDLEIDLSEPIPMRYLGLHRVCEMVKERLALEVADTINTFRQSPRFLYLQAYVNTTKHRSLVDVTHSISLELSDPRYGIKILPFEYKGKSFAEKWAYDFVGQDFRAICEGIFRIGSAMNRSLRRPGI
jgi:hypothetical protein